ncbi:MAG TPA: WbqC family protein [Candidatus Omnitrophota bacterium]|nr:WbqC family protein [Candidatus Omnitrophota bacterium]HPB68773.1 WbqC family protein [Candidatus Omnitrophota bacterium]HQO58537.1 WbqC family protein [Candidatus Omnitrophota bacterium]HQP12611.1 WbqC family protein [Candidatus Omnitrophota bacterium]
MRISIMQPGYIPWLGFFELMARCDVFVILDDVSYTKRDWRSRNRIRTKQGWIWLTVPVLSKNRSGQLILETKINNDKNWRAAHLKCLEIHYSQSAYFKKYIHSFKDLYSRDWELLIDLDMAIISFLAEALDIGTRVIRSSQLEILGLHGNQRILAICEKLQSRELYDSQGAKPFIDLALFQEKGIRVEFQEFRHPTYRQVYAPFLPFMSAVDLLFNEGPHGKEIILGN